VDRRYLGWMNGEHTREPVACCALAYVASPQVMKLRKDGFDAGTDAVCAANSASERTVS